MLLVLLWTTAARAADPVPLNAGAAVMSFPAGHGIAVTGGYGTDAPAVVVTDAGTVASAAYDHVGSGDGEAVGTATVVTPNGSRFAFTDQWIIAHDGSFRLSRQVTVTAADPRDAGFDTRFGLTVPNAKSVRDVELFAPGVWYRHNDHAVPKAIGANPSLSTYLIKETRLAMPMVMARPNGGGPSLSICHADARPSTGLRDADPAPQTDASIQYGSIGFYDGHTVGFCYPGTEADVAYGAHGPRLRFHPVRPGVPHGYDLTVRVGPAAADFPTAMTDAWPRAVAAAPPSVRRADPAVYREGLAVFAHYYRDDFKGGGRGLPFVILLGLHPTHPRVPNATPLTIRGPRDWHVQSGFVGMQIPAAYLMIRQAVKDHDAATADRWASVVDFWVDHSISPAGVPRTDYFCAPATWSTGPVFLRTLSDGTEGVVDAYRVRRDPRWLAYARRVGDWLLARQAADGSWARSYNPADGTVAHPGQFNTTNPLRLLVELHAVTGDARYLDAARRAGQWCLAHVDGPAEYVGGAIDNNNTIDKEGGVLAFYGFGALYDATGERRWLDAARRAADYVETWTYCWSYPVQPLPGIIAPTRRSPWPDCGLVGQSLVATGHSYADMFMVGCATAYYRLSLQSGDAHYRDVARLLAEAANRPADITGALGYPDRGEIEEGITPADFVAYGPGHCLPWCTAAQVRPVADLQDLFGCDTIDDVEQRLTPPARQSRNRPWYAVRP